MSTFCTRLWTLVYTGAMASEPMRAGSAAGRWRGRVGVDAAVLRGLREGRPLTVRELAELSGVSYNTITMLENRHRTANPSTVRKLAAALGVEPRELMAQGGE